MAAGGFHRRATAAASPTDNNPSQPDLEQELHGVGFIGRTPHIDLEIAYNTDHLDVMCDIFRHHSANPLAELWHISYGTPPIL